jgi:hypothetical protein
MPSGRSYYDEQQTCFAGLTDVLLSLSSGTGR